MYDFDKFITSWFVQWENNGYRYNRSLTDVAINNIGSAASDLADYMATFASGVAKRATDLSYLNNDTAENIMGMAYREKINGNEAKVAGYFCLQIVRAATKHEKSILVIGNNVELKMNKDSYSANYYEKTNVTRFYQKTIYHNPIVWFSKGNKTGRVPPNFVDGKVAKINKYFFQLKNSSASD